MTPSRLSDVERELNNLRARAYGPKPDIEADPAAIARLIELEAADAGVATPGNTAESVGSRAPDAGRTAPPAIDNVEAGPAEPTAKPMIRTTSGESFGRSLWQRATATRSGAWFTVGSIVVVASLIYTTWLLVPHPDATLQLTAGEADTFIETLIAQDEDPDFSTLRQFDPYHDIDVWSVQVSSVENGLGTCLIALDRTGSGRYQYECLPTGLEVILHMSVIAEDEFGFGEWLPHGSVISLHLRENTVDVFVHSPPAAT